MGIIPSLYPYDGIGTPPNESATADPHFLALADKAPRGGQDGPRGRRVEDHGLDIDVLRNYYLVPVNFSDE